MEKSTTKVKGYRVHVNKLADYRDERQIRAILREYQDELEDSGNTAKAFFIKKNNPRLLREFDRIFKAWRARQHPHVR